MFSLVTGLFTGQHHTLYFLYGSRLKMLNTRSLGGKGREPGKPLGGKGRVPGKDCLLCVKSPYKDEFIHFLSSVCVCDHMHPH